MWDGSLSRSAPEQQQQRWDSSSAAVSTCQHASAHVRGLACDPVVTELDLRSLCFTSEAALLLLLLSMLHHHLFFWSRDPAGPGHVTPLVEEQL